MLTKNISFKNFRLKKKNNKIEKYLNFILKENNEIIKSLRPNYKNSYNQKLILKSRNNNTRIIGMGGSILGAKSIYDFLKHKIKKNFIFISNLQSKVNIEKKKNQSILI